MKTPASLVCVDIRDKKNIRGNDRVALSLLNGMGLRVRNRIYSALLSDITSKDIRDGMAAGEVFLSGISRNDKRYILNGIEFVTLQEDGRLIAAASINYGNAMQKIENVLSKDYFIMDYCKFQICRAEKFIHEEKYDNALELLKEIKKLQWPEPDAYILSSEALLHKNENKHAFDIAESVFNTMKPKLTSDYYERLGNIFFRLDRLDLAEKCYISASDSFDCGAISKQR